MLKMMNVRQQPHIGPRPSTFATDHGPEAAARFDEALESTPSSTVFSKSFYEAYSDMDSSRTSVISDGEEPITRVSSGSSLESSIAHGTRYKLTMKLSPRDIMLVRESWSIMLDDECPPEKLKSFVSKLAAGRVLTTTETGASRSRRAGHQMGRTPLASIDQDQSAERAGPRARLATNIKSSNSLFGAQFLENIIALAPHLQTLFPTIKHVAVGVTGVLTIAVNNLEDLSVMDGYLTSLGKRHARILGVTADQFEFAGAAFLQTVQERFGVACTVELEETWRRLYSFLANSLLQFGIDPTIELQTRDNEVVLMAPPELNGRVPAKKPETTAHAAARLQQKSLLDPVAMSREQRASGAPSMMPVGTSVPPRSVKRNAQPGFSKGRKSGEKDCVIM